MSHIKWTQQKTAEYPTQRICILLCSSQRLPSVDTDLFKSLEILSLTIQSLELSDKNEHHGTHPHSRFEALENGCLRTIWNSWKWNQLHSLQATNISKYVSSY